MVVKVKFCKFIALICFCSLLVFSSGCRSLFISDPHKKAEKAERRKELEAQKNYQSFIKAHYKNQDKKTRKRMKKNLRKAKKQNKKKKSGWDCR